VYDLNIFQEEQLNDEGNYEHMGPWHIHIYEYNGRTTEEVGSPIELTHEEYTNLIRYDQYFSDDPDVWYGLEGFMKDKWDAMSDRLKATFEGLPKYKD